MIWCLKYIYTDFSNYIFVDETTVRVNDIPYYHLRKPSKRPKALPTTLKYRAEINVWGGISYNRPTNFVVIRKFFQFCLSASNLYFIHLRCLLKTWTVFCTVQY